MEQAYNIPKARPLSFNWPSTASPQYKQINGDISLHHTINTVTDSTEQHQNRATYTDTLGDRSIYQGAVLVARSLDFRSKRTQQFLQDFTGIESQ